MKTNLQVFIGNSTNPWFNLATEDYLFSKLRPHAHVLFLWRNKETVVIGRFQNPWVECNLAKMESEGVSLARRQSGGGAVYHDLGNTNFTFLSGARDYDKNINNQIIMSAIQSFGVKAYSSGRNDLVVHDKEGVKKFSGSAFKQKKDRSFHHGTLLINADLNRLGHYLKPHPKKIQAKGIKSVRSRVTNLSSLNIEITHDSLTPLIIHQFFDYYQNECEIEYLDENRLAEIGSLNAYYQQLADWGWRFGETPQFTHFFENFFDWGQMSVHLDVHRGIIQMAKLFSDSLHPEMVGHIEKSFRHTPYQKEAMQGLLQKWIQQLPMHKSELEEFYQWLCREIS